MTNEELILARLEAMEEKISMMHSRAETMAELGATLTPIMRDSLHNVMLGELDALQHRCELDDLSALLKRFVMSVRNITWALERLDDLVDIWALTEPMIKPTFLAAIDKFQELDEKGVFKSISALGESMGKITDKYSPEEIGRMGDGLVVLAGLLEKMGDADLDNAQPVSPLGMVGKLHSQESKQALGLIMELLAALGKEKA
ncbi:DUF1641 domain-containing protein [Halodesulfovibrio sp.]|jgi:uncharacterized protein YjgD (DUF1641 family)|uniref:DUF1641 domain-containing protein n=1 Tax=Halodesulfovibrio sp. TaxID=1912772 RepID=UPI0025D2FF51|nr:DUF1641 domain-containing protein [Halodesulfovibrio sp.]MCT4533821.1 DUF1641 domain-containing protein [Halodesulfovibrio sp.]